MIYLQFHEHSEHFHGRCQAKATVKAITISTIYHNVLLIAVFNNSSSEGVTW